MKSHYLAVYRRTSLTISGQGNGLIVDTLQGGMLFGRLIAAHAGMLSLKFE